MPPGSQSSGGTTPPGKPFGTVFTKPPVRPRSAAWLKSPLRMASVGTHERPQPVSMRCRKYSKPRKKKTRSRPRLKLVPGTRSGPLNVKPG